jgi:ABC-type amino acid transport substrate-binding protein
MLTVALASVIVMADPASAGERLDSIRHKGFLTCGVGADVPGFSQQSADGQWRGFDVDICEAIGAAIFGAPGKVVFRPVETLQTFLREPDIDIVLRGLTWTSGRELQDRMRFGPIVLYDGQAFLVPKKLNIDKPEELSGHPICVSTDAGFLGGVRSYFREHNLILRAVIKNRRADSEAALFAGQCDAMTADASELAEALIGRAAQPEDYRILPQQISKEPLAPLLGHFRFDRRGGTGDHLGQSGHDAVPRRPRREGFFRRPGSRKSDPGAGLGCRGGGRRRKLWRDLRTQSGPGQQGQAGARLQQILDCWRIDVRSPHSLKFHETFSPGARIDHEIPPSHVQTRGDPHGQLSYVFYR